MCDIEVLDTYFSLLYSGKPENPDQFYVLGTDEKTHYNLSKDTSIRGRNISMDRYFTSIPLSEWLLDKNITFVGTLQKNHIGITAEIKDVKEREEKLTVFVYKTKNNLILDRQEEKQKDMALTTMSDDVLVLTKSDVFTFYDKNKGGLDIVDYVFRIHFNLIQIVKMADECICLLV